MNTNVLLCSKSLRLRPTCNQLSIQYIKFKIVSEFLTLIILIMIKNPSCLKEAGGILSIYYPRNQEISKLNAHVNVLIRFRYERRRLKKKKKT